MATDVEDVTGVPAQKRLKAVGFVLFAFFLWFLFVWLSRIVMNCVPTFKAWPTFECRPINIASLRPMAWSDTFMMLATLVIAIWAARRVVFPPDD